MVSPGGKCRTVHTKSFLDLAGHLKSPPFGDPKKVFDELKKTVWVINDAQRIITQMLKQQKLNADRRII